MSIKSNFCTHTPSLSVLARAIGLSVLGAAVFHSPAHAATILVDTNGDATRGCTFREAVDAINDQPINLDNDCVNSGDAFGVNDTIIFAPDLSGEIIEVDGSPFYIGRSFSDPRPNVDVTIDARELANGVELSGNKASQILTIRSSTVNLLGITMTSGLAGVYDSGGAINSNSSNITLTDCVIEGNSSTGSGGGIFAGNSSVTLIDSAVYNNKAESSGGAISVGSSSLTLINAVISNNTAASNAGAIRMGSTSVATINDSTISDNTGSLVGSISVEQTSTMTLNNSTVVRSIGSGISVNNASLILNDSTVANSQGSGLRGQSPATLALNRSRVSGNVSEFAGGGIRGFTAATLVDSTVTGNIAGTQGGGIIGVIDLALINSVVSNNTAGTLGGGIDSFGGGGISLTVSLLNSSIEDNTAGTRGGGLNIRRSFANLQDSTLRGNTAVQRGGAFYSYDSVVGVTNSTISANSAGQNGGGVSIYSTQVDMNHVTVANNSAFNNGGGIQLSTGILNAVNTIVADNSSGMGGDDCFDATPSTSTRSIDLATIIEDGSCDASRSGDPMLLPLANNGGELLTHALAADSPARNTAPAATCLASDQLGMSRDTSDGFCDIGAFEFKEQTGFFVIPLDNGKSVVIPL